MGDHLRQQVLVHLKLADLLAKLRALIAVTQGASFAARWPKAPAAQFSQV
jgi:hypothetical protein